MKKKRGTGRRGESGREKGRKWNSKKYKMGMEEGSSKRERERDRGGITRPYLTLLDHLPRHPRGKQALMRRHASLPTASRTSKKDVGIAREPLPLLLLLLLLCVVPRETASLRGGLFTLACPRRNFILGPWFLKQSKWILG